jgi:phospholipid/cholesterol/gamma-HCH transport system permease protein
MLQAFQSVTHITKAHFGPFLDVVIKQIFFTGNRAMFIIGFLAIGIGGLTIMNALPALQGVGKKELISDILIFVIIREIGPMITGIIIIIRSGSAITAEIATQKMNKELDAIELHGIDLYQYIVMPRVFGGIISTVCLLIYFDIFALGGGYIFASLLQIDISAVELFSNIMRAISMGDLVSSILKGIFFGLFIPMVCTYHGFLPEKLYEIPIYVSAAVVRSLVTIFVLGGIISTMFYL